MLKLHIFLRVRGAVAAFSLAAAATAPTAHAGRPCETTRATLEQISQGMALAEATRQALDASGAQVVLLARAGQDLSRYGLRWSHMGWAYREPLAQGGHVWRVAHKLNHCGTADAAVYRQGLGELFLDQPHRYVAAFVPLAPAAQQRLWPALRDNGRLAAVHTQRYNMVAYPWATTYQQSNQWALESLAYAMQEGSANYQPERSRAQQWLMAQDYRAGVLHVGALTRLGARATMAHVAFDDHPNHKRFADRIETVTVESAFGWLQARGLGGPTRTVVAPPGLAL